MDKKQIRQQVRKKILEMSAQTYNERSAFISNKLIALPSIIEGKTIAITISVKPEVDTIRLIEKFWALGKRVVVPKCDPTTREMTFYQIDAFTQTEVVYMELKEPIPNLCEKVSKDQIDVCIVPGIVFDIQGFRIGYGGGYYDRFLQNYQGETISVAFHEQLVNKVPRETHDLPVNTILTDQTWIEI